MAEPLTWTTDEPTVSGWWWVHRKDDRFEVADVHFRHGVLQARLTTGLYYVVQHSVFKGARWAGPIPEPAERRAGG